MPLNDSDQVIRPQPVANQGSSESPTTKLSEKTDALRGILFFICMIVLGLFTGVGALANFGLVGTSYESGRTTNIGAGLFLLVLTVVTGTFVIMAIVSYVKDELVSNVKPGQPKLRAFVKSASSKWKVVSASAAPIFAIYHFAHGHGLKATFPQVLAAIGYLTTLSIGCGGMAYAFVAGIFSWSKPLKAFFGTCAAIATISFLLYKFPFKTFAEEPGTSWTNPAVILFGGFGLSVLFAVYFWLIWRPIREWLDS